MKNSIQQFAERGSDHRATAAKAGKPVVHPKTLAFSLQPSAFPLVPLIFHHGNVNEIMGRFGGADQLRNAINQLQSLLYAA